MTSARFIHESEARTTRGFSLIEVLVVVAIMVALSAIAIPAYQGYMDDVRLSNVRKDMALISIHLERFRTENRGSRCRTRSPRPLRARWRIPGAIPTSI